MERTILSLGSNLGDSLSILQEVIASLDMLGEQIEVSEFYTTAPWGKKDQPNFINCAVSMWVLCKPLQLLHAIQKIEHHFGRERKEHWGARKLDIDIVLFGKKRIKSSVLTVPHPHFSERNFVLVPLQDLHSKSPFVEFGLNTTIEELIDNCKDTAKVTKLEVNSL